MQESPINWGQKLRDARADRGNMSQAEAARRIGVSKRSIIKWENGQQIPTPSHQILIQLFADEKI